MTQQAIGLIETKGLIALVYGTDSMLKAADVRLVGPMKQVGSGLVTAVITGDVAAQAAATQGEVVSVQVIPRPHDDVRAVLPTKPAAKGK
jgi:microcompartment protein CcmL/EutN